MRLLERDDEMLSALKTIKFLANSLTKLHESALSNVIPYPLYTCFSLLLIFTTLVAPNKQSLNLKLLVGFLGQAYKS